MGRIKVEISKNKVLESVKNIAAYMGAKTSDATGSAAYDKVAIFDEDATVVDDLWSLSCNELVHRYVRYITSHVDVGSALVIELDMPNNTLANIQELLTASSKSFIEYCILSKWCDIAKQEDAKIYEEDLQVAANAIKSALDSRVHPSRSNNNR